MLLFLHTIVNWLQQHQLVCPLKKMLDISCPGCGMQRSFVALLSGDFYNSISFHPVTIPLLVFFLYSALHLVFRFKNGNTIIIYSYVLLSALIVTNYIYRIITKT